MIVTVSEHCYLKIPILLKKTSHPAYGKIDFCDCSLICGILQLSSLPIMCPYAQFSVIISVINNYYDELTD